MTDPKHPRYLHHIPGAEGEAEAGGAAMVRVCDGKTLPRAPKDRTYLLRTLGNLAHEIWDVTDPAKPARLTTVLDGLKSTHKNWWECDTGIAYLVSDGAPSGWRTNRMTRIYDLGDPAHPRFIRDFGLPGQEPGSTGTAPEGVHGPIALRNRVYFAYGTGAKGVLQIVDRDKLLAGDPQAADRLAPTVANLLYPQIGRLDMSPAWGGAHQLPDPGRHGAALGPGRAGTDARLRAAGLGVAAQRVSARSASSRSWSTSPPSASRSRWRTFEVPDPTGDFCRRGGRFGPHSSNESFSPIYYGRLVFIAYFNAGVRAVDVRDPFHPTEAGFYIPSVTARTDKRCVEVPGGPPRCKVAIQTNNVDVDDRGYVYLADRADTGLHVVEPTGAARAIANFSR